MNRINLLKKEIFLFIIFTLLFSMCNLCFADFSDSVYNIKTGFIGDGKTMRGFSWTADSEHTAMVIQYMKKGDYWTDDKKEKSAEYTVYEDLLYYKVDIDGLIPGEEYEYRIGDKNDNIWSDFYSFRTEPENLKSFSFIGISDSQSGTEADSYDIVGTVIKKAMKDVPDTAFFVNMGDVVNLGDSKKEYDRYFKAMGNYIKTLPVMAVLGNHDSRGDSITAGKYFSLHFNNPDNAKSVFESISADDVERDFSKGVVNNMAETVYSFEYGNAHFAVLNSSSDWDMEDTYTILEAQKEWLRNDLKNTDKKWKIVLIHQGMYTARTDRFNTKSVLLDVIDECEVDLVLQGHDHIVTRTYPMKNDKIVSKSNADNIFKGTGTVYTIFGSAGPFRPEYLYKAEEYAAVMNTTSSENPCYSIFEISDNNITVTTKQINGFIVDKFSIKNTN